MRMAVRRVGRGPDVVLFHGGMGSWKHWIRNLDALAARFTVHALDHPSYGDSAPVPREKSDLPAFQSADHVRLRRIAEWSRKAQFLFGFKAGHRIQSASAYDADLCFLLQIHCPY